MTEHDRFWHQQYKKLVEFKRMNGHCRVPHRFEQDKSLGGWVARQRNHHKHNKLRLDSKRLLDEIGFAWKADEANNMLWHQQYEKLVQFKGENGHCMVPTTFQHNKSFGLWVMTQRSNHVHNKMRLDRKRLLNEIGFVWKVIVSRNINDQLWHQHYEELVEFKRKNGHCVVPWSDDKKGSRFLANWISKQRTLQSNDKLRLGRKTLLDEIGVAWKDEGAQKHHNHTHNNDKIGDQQYAELETTTEPAAQDLAESGEIMGPWINQRDKATATNSCNYVKEDKGRDENDSKPSLVTSSDAPTGSYQNQEKVVQEEEEEEAPGGIPSGWKVLFPI
jgi:hypothetical protein